MFAHAWRVHVYVHICVCVCVSRLYYKLTFAALYKAGIAYNKTHSPSTRHTT